MLGQPRLSLRVALAEHMAAVGVPISLRWIGSVYKVYII